MCDHSISRKVQRDHQGLSQSDIDRAFATEAYSTHGLELRRIVARMLECEECTEMLLAQTFLVLPHPRGAQPTLTELIRTALVFASGALGDIARQQLQARIRTWYINSTSDPGASDLLTTPG